MTIKRLELVWLTPYLDRMMKGNVFWNFGQNPTSWHHLTSFSIFTKCADVIIIFAKIWVRNIFFLKQDVSSYKMRGQTFSYDNPFKSYWFFNFGPIMTSLWRHDVKKWRHRQIFDVDRKFLGHFTIMPSYKLQIFVILRRPPTQSPV